MLRLNVAIPPAPSPNILGILGGDLAGFLNGRRVFDDVVTIELRAIAGAGIPADRSDVRPRWCGGRGDRRGRPARERQLSRHLPVPRHSVSGYDVMPLSS
jgi:hypothetical protein